MGRAGMRRKSRRQVVKVHGEAGWELKYSPFSPAGEVEGAQRFARGFSYLSPRRRWATRIVVLLLLTPFAVYIGTLVGHLFGH